VLPGSRARIVRCGGRYDPQLVKRSSEWVSEWGCSKSAAVYKISSKLDDFSLRYGDTTIFKMAAVRHVELFYHHTRPPTKSLLLTAAACQISCQSDTQIWRCSYLNFLHIWLEMPIQVPKMGVWGDFGPPKCDYLSSRPPKGTSLRKSASFKLSIVKIRWGVRPVGELTESVMDRHTQVNLYSVHA